MRRRLAAGAYGRREEEALPLSRSRRGHKKMKQGGDGDGDSYAGEGSVLPASEAAASIVSASDRATLMRERKLILILDLDATLLDSTPLDDLSPDEQANGLTPDTIGDPRVDLFRLDIDNFGSKLVKLRPFVRGFLEQASAMFEMHVYTLGVRAYATAVVGLLDPDGVYLGGRIVSRDESTRRYTKSLDVIQGADPAMVVILDDNADVWPGHLHNLIHMFDYLYFASTCRSYDVPSLAEQGVDEREHDGLLAVVLDVLRRVHQRFFDGNRADVREVIAEVRRQVLPGCTLAFSFREQVKEDFPETTRTWRLAEALGAVCKKDVDEEVTHIVAEDAAAEKARWARANGKFLVNPGWVEAASFWWRRLDELASPAKFRNLL